MISRLWGGYNRVLAARPTLTKACTSLTGFTFGDVLAQNLLEPAGTPYDFARTCKLASFGFLVRCQLLHAHVSCATVQSTPLSLRLVSSATVAAA